MTFSFKCAFFLSEGPLQYPQWFRPIIQAAGDCRLELRGLISNLQFKDKIWGPSTGTCGHAWALVAHAPTHNSLMQSRTNLGQSYDSSMVKRTHHMAGGVESLFALTKHMKMQIWPQMKICNRQLKSLRKSYLVSVTLGCDLLLMNGNCMWVL